MPRGTDREPIRSKTLSHKFSIKIKYRQHENNPLRLHSAFALKCDENNSSTMALNYWFSCKMSIKKDIKKLPVRLRLYYYVFKWIMHTIQTVYTYTCIYKYLGDRTRSQKNSKVCRTSKIRSHTHGLCY